MDNKKTLADALVEGVEAEKNRARETVERLSWFVTDAPLYRIVKVPMKSVAGLTAYQFMPETVSMSCDRCALDVTNWDGAGSRNHTTRALGSATYRCRNCRESFVTIYYLWFPEGEQSHFEKVGRYPRPEIDPPRELANALGNEHTKLYRRGMTLRHHDFGLGALVYFRRIVEEKTGELLDLLEMAVRETGGEQEEQALQVIAQAKTARRFEEKVEIAARALPSHLRVGGTNPLEVLYQLVSDGLHARTDEEAVDIVDGIRKVLEYLFSELKAHTAKRREYAEGMRSLLARRDAAKKKL